MSIATIARQLDAEGDSLAQAHARARQVLLMTVMMEKLDFLLAEAARVRIAAPGVIELREWAKFNLDENADLAAEAIAMRKVA